MTLKRIKERSRGWKDCSTSMFFNKQPVDDCNIVRLDWYSREKQQEDEKKQFCMFSNIGLVDDFIWFDKNDFIWFDKKSISKRSNMLSNKWLVDDYIIWLDWNSISKRNNKFSNKWLVYYYNMVWLRGTICSPTNAL